MHYKYILSTDTAWRVKITIRYCHKTVTKQFNFSKLGGKKRALVAAIEYRDEILKQYDLLDYLHLKKSPDLHTQRQTACIGVYRTHNWQCNKLCHNWTMHTVINKQYVKRHFSIKKYGNKQAFLLACEARYFLAGKIIVVDKSQIPCRPTVPYAIRNR